MQRNQFCFGQMLPSNLDGSPPGDTVSAEILGIFPLYLSSVGLWSASVPSSISWSPRALLKFSLLWWKIWTRAFCAPLFRPLLGCSVLISRSFRWPLSACVHGRDCWILRRKVGSIADSSEWMKLRHRKARLLRRGASIIEQALNRRRLHGSCSCWFARLGVRRSSFIRFSLLCLKTEHRTQSWLVSAKARSHDAHGTPSHDQFSKAAANHPNCAAEKKKTVATWTRANTHLPLFVCGVLKNPESSAVHRRKHWGHKFVLPIDTLHHWEVTEFWTPSTNDHLPQHCLLSFSFSLVCDLSFSWLLGRPEINSSLHGRSDELDSSCGLRDFVRILRTRRNFWGKYLHQGVILQLLGSHRFLA